MAKRCMGCMKMKNNSPICEHCGYDENIPNPSNTLPIGTVLRGRYQVGRMLDLNDFSITYIGWDNYANSPIAIKEFYPNILASRDCSNSLSVSYHDASCQEYKNRFQLEARELWQPNWVYHGIGIHLHNIFEENNTSYMVMEYMEGLSLREYLHLRKQPFHLTEILPIMLPVIKTLEQLHEINLVYERFSPDSILIQEDSTVKLLDFVTNSFHRRWKEYNSLDDRYIFINPFFSIETYNTRYGDPGPWSDVYSVCAILYYCLTGKAPMNCFERLNGKDTIDWKQIPGLSRHQIAALEKGMAVDYKKRTDSLEELELELFRYD